MKLAFFLLMGALAGLAAGFLLMVFAVALVSLAIAVGPFAVALPLMALLGIYVGWLAYKDDEE